MAQRIKLVEKLRDENDKLKAENEQLRDAARQLLAGLSEYAKQENWLLKAAGEECGLWHWKGEGNGPAVARKFLGLDQQEDGKEE